MAEGDQPIFTKRLNQLWSMVCRPDGREYATEEVTRHVQAHGVRITGVYMGQLRHGTRSNPTVEVLRALGAVFFVPPAFWLVDEDEAASILADLEALMAVWHTPVRQIARRLRRLVAVGSQLDEQEASNPEVARQVQARGAAVTDDSLELLLRDDVPAHVRLRDLPGWAEDPLPIQALAKAWGVSVRFFAVSDREATWILHQLRALTMLEQGGIDQLAARTHDLADQLDGLVELLSRSQVDLGSASRRGRPAQRRDQPGRHPHH